MEPIRLMSHDVLAGLVAVARGRADESTRYSIEGILLAASLSAGVRLATTDGRRLHEYAVSDEPRDIDIRHVMQPGGAANLAAFCMDTPEVSLFKTDGLRFVSQDGKDELELPPPEGKFPEYEEVIPSPTVLWEVDRRSIGCAVRILADTCKKWTNGECETCENPERNDMRIELAFSGSAIRLSLINGAYDDDPVAAMSVRATGNQAISIGMNPLLVLDAIEACEGAIIKIGMTVPDKPMLVSSGAFRGVVMPCRKDC